MMGSIENYYGKYAGKVWQTLENHGPATPNQIMKKTKMTQTDFYAAIGWLAKENKICKTGTKYSLGECNFEPRIGKNAGKMWKTLNKIGYVDEEYVPKIAGMSNTDAFSAMGWLAREGKITMKRVKPKKPMTKFGLKNK